MGVVVMAALVGPAAGGTGVPQQVTLTVTVVDGNANPLAGAAVEVSWEDGMSRETTKSNGKALVDVPEGERVEIDVEHSHYVRNFPYVVEEASAGEVTVSVAKKGRAAVRTIDSDGHPVNARVIVGANGREVVSGTSGSDGIFQTGAIERGKYRVTVIRSGYYRNETMLDVDGEVKRNIALERGSVVVEFSVRDDHFDPPRPVRNAIVEVGDIGVVKTLGNGEATLTVPVNSRHEVTISKEGYETTSERLTVFQRPVALNATLRRVPTLVVEPANRRIVVGERVRVKVEDEYGASIGNATVTLDNDAIGETNGEGELHVPVKSAGNHTLIASAGGIESDPVTVEGVQPGGNDESTPEPAEPDPTPTETVAVDLPGFTPGITILGVLAVALVLRRRR